METSIDVQLNESYMELGLDLASGAAELLPHGCGTKPIQEMVWPARGASSLSKSLHGCDEKQLCNRGLNHARGHSSLVIRLQLCLDLQRLSLLHVEISSLCLLDVYCCGLTLHACCC